MKYLIIIIEVFITNNIQYTNLLKRSIFFTNINKKPIILNK